MLNNKLKFFYLILIISTLPLNAKELDLNFSLTPSIGLKFGSVGEYVFNQSSQGADFSHVPDGYKQISYLSWDIKPLCTLNLDASININDLYLALDFATGFHTKSGEMEDFDWLGPQGVLTRYSCHPNQITNYFLGKILIGWNTFVEEKNFFWQTTLGLEFERIGFNSTDGFKQYVPNDAKEWTSDIEKVYMHGDIISYSQDSLLLIFSNKISYPILPNFILGFSFEIKPLLLFNGYDTHFKRDLQFLDTNMNGTIPLGLAIETEYELSTFSWLYFKVSADWIPISNGKVYSKDSSDEYYYPDPSSSSGGSKWTAGIESGIRIKL